MMNVVKSLWSWDDEKEKSENNSGLAMEAHTVISQPKSESEKNNEVSATTSDGDVNDQKFDYSELDRQMEEDLKAVVNSAKEWGSYLFNFGKRATVMAANQVNEAARFIKEQVEESGNIDQDHRNDLTGYFVDATHTPPNTPTIVTKELPQWLNFLTPSFSDFNENGLKLAVLKLSTDKANFINEPENVAGYPDLSADQIFSSALAALRFDERLKEMRFTLVPRKVKEEKFWKNYFQRVWLITQSISTNEDCSDLVAETVKRLQIAEVQQDSLLSTERIEMKNDRTINRPENEEIEDDTPQEEDICNPQIPSSDSVSLDDFEIVAKEDVIQDPGDSTQ